MDELAQGALTLLTELAQAMRELAPEVWAIYLRQAYIEGASKLVPIVFYLPFVFIAWRVLCRNVTKSLDDVDTMVVAGIFALISSLIGIVVVGEFVIALKMIANPQYYALQMLLEKLTGH
jgi:hypothetical protein